VTRRGWLLFLAMSVIWGVPYLFIRVAVRDVSPSGVVFARTLVAALLLAPLAIGRGQHRRLRGHWRAVIAFTALEIAIPWYLLTSAEKHLSSSLAGLLVAAVPLIGVVLGRALGEAEVTTPRRWTGLVLGFAGVAFLVGLQFGRVDMTAVVEVVLVAVCYAAGPFVLTRRLSDVPSLAVISASLTITAIAYAPFAIASRPDHVGTKPLLAILALAVVCTAVGFLVFFVLVADVGPTRSTVVTYVNPAVAIALGVVVLGEHLTAGMIVGFPLVLIGSALATSRGVTAAPAVEAQSVLPESRSVRLG
jgi:drug/metabolite transporter (DMT)-like permease